MIDLRKVACGFSLAGLFSMGPTLDPYTVSFPTLQAVFERCAPVRISSGRFEAYARSGERDYGIAIIEAAPVRNTVSLSAACHRALARNVAEDIDDLAAWRVVFHGGVRQYPQRTHAGWTYLACEAPQGSYDVTSHE